MVYQVEIAPDRVPADLPTQPKDIRNRRVNSKNHLVGVTLLLIAVVAMLIWFTNRESTTGERNQPAN